MPVVRKMESPRTPLGHNPFKNLKARIKERPQEEPQETQKQAPREPVVPAAVHDPEADGEFFRQAMEGTRPMAGSNREEGRGKTRPAGVSPKSPAEEALEGMKALISSGLGFVVADTPEYIEGTGYQVDPMMAERLHRGEFSIQAHIDLHGLGAEQARIVFEDFLRESVIRNRRSLLVIHGRGLSSQGEPILKAKVTEWLTRGPWRKWVIAYSSARLCDGGAGATCILLRTRPVTKRQKKNPSREHT
jgi:DNA-nicking Smr family endonuclease